MRNAAVQPARSRQSADQVVNVGKDKDTWCFMGSWPRRRGVGRAWKRPAEGNKEENEGKEPKKNKIK